PDRRYWSPRAAPHRPGTARWSRRSLAATIGPTAGSVGASGARDTRALEHGRRHAGLTPRGVGDALAFRVRHGRIDEGLLQRFEVGGLLHIDQLALEVETLLDQLDPLGGVRFGIDGALDV